MPYQIESTDFASLDVQQPAFLRMNPNGKVPVLVDGDTILWESLAINVYLARSYAPHLLPQSQAHLLAWTCWAMGELEGPHDAANRSGQTLDLERLDRSLDALRGAVEKRYIMGDAFSVADLNTAAVLLRPHYKRIVLRDEALKGWFQRCIERPALSKATRS